MFSLAVLCLPVSRMTAQQLYFPREASHSSPQLPAAMQALAARLLPLLQEEEDKWSSLPTLFMVQMTAGRYDAALRTIAAYRAIYSRTDTCMAGIRFIQYHTYARAKLLQQQHHRQFPQAFRSAFATALQQLTPCNRFDTDSWFTFDLPAVTADFRRELDRWQQRDSIDVNNAITLCRRYNAWRVATAVMPLAAPLIAQENRQHYLINDSILIRTRDGAEVPAIVVRPKHQQQPLPVIFFFTIYTEIKNLSIAKEAADRGYVGVVANSRGKRGSSGEVTPYEHDGRDAWDVTDWISKQSWCNGSIGMYGGSYVGFTQWAAVKQGVHPALKTIVPSAAVVPGFDVPKENNVFMNFVYPWIPYVTNNKYLDNVSYNNQPHWRNLSFNWYHSGAAYRTMDSIDGVPSKIFRRWISHPSYDKYWQDMTCYREDFSRVNIPVLTTTGYYDGAQIGAMYYYRQHMQYRPGAQHYLVIGPWDHLGCQHVATPFVSGYKIDDTANISIHQLIYEWFAHILRGGPRPALLKDYVNYQVTGTNEWKHTASLAQMNNDTLTFYLDTSHLLRPSPSAGKGFLTQEIPLADRQGGFTYNAIQYPTISNSPNMTNGIRYESAPLTEALTINGAFSGQLHLTANKKDLDAGILLYEHLPDGRYFQLSYFIGRASYARSLETRTLLEPGQPAVFPFSNTRIICKKISKGSRLVVILNINQSPFEQVNYGSGKDVSDETIADGNTPLRIKWSGESYVSIPVWK